MRYPAADLPDLLVNTFTCPKCAKSFEEAPNFCPACGEDLRGLTPLSDTLSGAWAGKVIDARYRIREKLGEGGMGAVYKVEHVRMGKVLALKVLRPELALDKKLKSRFHQEARVVSKLSNPNTIQVFDFGELEDGSLYIAMEFMPGRDLAALLRTQGAFSEERAISIGLQVLASLAEAHEQGIIHRDVKPANVMLQKRKGRDDLVKVLDFGIAKLNEGEGRKHITGVAEFVGTPSYMSPEQARGDALDARSDLYSVGAMLFELVTARPPFEGPTPMSVVTQHLDKPPPRLGEIVPGKLFSPGFEAVLRKALAKDRQERFSSAEEMTQALERTRTALEVPSPHEVTPLPGEMDVARREDFDRFERSLKLRRAMGPVVALAVLAGLGAGGYWYVQQRAKAALVNEREPNDEVAQANRITLGQPITGKIGKRQPNGASDRDVFVLDVEAPGVLSVELTGVEDMNLVASLERVDRNGKPAGPRLTLDDAPTGQGERVDAFAVGAGRLYVWVEERAHFTEPVRPPRETTVSSYTLTLTAAEAPKDGDAEVEPNDRLDTATQIAPGHFVSARTGVGLPYDASFARRELSGVDYFLAAGLGANAPKTWALVVPPPGGTLLAVDAGELEEWQRKMSSVDASLNPVLPSAVTASKPELVPLTATSLGRGVRVQGAVATPPGSAYRVAFVTAQPEGLASALELAKVLEAEGRGADVDAVVALAEKAAPRASQLAALKALHGAKSSAAATRTPP